MKVILLFDHESFYMLLSYNILLLFIIILQKGKCFENVYHNMTDVFKNCIHCTLIKILCFEKKKMESICFRLVIIGKMIISILIYSELNCIIL